MQRRQPGFNFDNWGTEPTTKNGIPGRGADFGRKMRLNFKWRFSTENLVLCLGVYIKIIVAPIIVMGLDGLA